MQGVHESRAEALEPLGLPMAIVGVSAQRIKQYVYESPGLPEIRGASQLLDEAVDSLAGQVVESLGAEMVLQAAASTLIFLAPEPGDWAIRLKRAFGEQTRVALVASAGYEVPLAQMVGAYAESMRGFLAALDADRYRAESGFYRALPFEQRCAFCRVRPAEGFTELPDGLEPICYPCLLKRESGRTGRRQEAREFAQSLGLDAQVPPSLNELVPDTGEHRQIAFIYGDGRNFGQITKNLQSLAQSLQWTNRAQIVVESATLLALGQSLNEAVHYEPQTTLDYYPFEILVMGGDDFSLFCWSRLALRFCQQFLYLADLEFQKGDVNRCIVGEVPIAFGLGCLISDEKTPVRLTVEFTERQLLKWAKKPIHLRGRSSRSPLPSRFRATSRRSNGVPPSNAHRARQAK